MEPTITSSRKDHVAPASAIGGAARSLARQATSVIASGPLDLRSTAFMLLGAGVFFALGVFCLAISRFDTTLASVWLPNGSAVAILLLARLRNEWPAYFGFATASFAANLISGNAAGDALIFTAANLIDIAVVTWGTRRLTSCTPDMTDLNHLGRFLIFGGVIGPVMSSAVALTAMGLEPSAILVGATSWFLADSMGMILTVPTIVLIADAVRRHETLSSADLAERCGLMIGGMIAVVLVFKQGTYPLLFLVPPVTLLVAFRLGGLGTALYVPGVAVVASWMTFEGVGPIANNAASDISKVYVIQAFIAANFLAGLPIVAILDARDRMTMALADGRRELALLAENVTDAVLRLDNKGTCTYASPSVREVLGREPDEMVGQPINRLAPGSIEEQVSILLESMLSGEVEKDRLTYRRLHDAEDGTPVFIEADCAIATDPVSGKRSGIVVSARDVTERVELELLLTRARRVAEEATQAKSEFLANMSHEIRTPMNGVLGFAELMLQGDLDDESRRHTEMIYQSGQSMMMLLNDILDLSKIEAGQITIDKTPVDLFATLTECAALHRPVAEKKGLELRFEPPCAETLGCAQDCQSCDSDAPHQWIMSDALRLRQIVLNLIGNAVKFTEFGRVEVDCALTDQECVIAISDTGIGISAARLETVFAPFTQAETSTARRFGGTGLGLAISRQLAGLLGGRIEVESEPGVGSTFRLILPRIAAHPAPIERSEDSREPSVAMPQSASILLVEDHDVNRMLGVEMLERCGQSVAVAHDGNEAVSMVMDSIMRGAPFDLVLMDIQMPGCDGYAATRTIRAEGIGPDVMPIIALTANAFPEDIAAARDAGMQAHLAKPLVFAELARALQRWLPTRIVEADAQPSAEPESDDAPGVADPEEASPRPLGPMQGPALRRRSPALLKRWENRRIQAVEAVRSALDDGSLARLSLDDDRGEALVLMVHKLAGTAAMFGEPDLGDQAAALERALRTDLPGDVREGLANDLLAIADEAREDLARTGS